MVALPVRRLPPFTRVPSAPAAQAWGLVTGDAREGIAAFLEKRPPAWSAG